MFTSKLDKLARAMAEFEGQNADVPTGRGSVAWRNHNPLNLRYSPFAIGVRDGFAYFQSDDIGLFAAMWDIHQKATGKTVTTLNGESTIGDLIRTWTADPAAVKKEYIGHVVSRTGFSEKMKLKDIIK